MDKKLLQEWLEEILPNLPSSLLNKLLQPLDIIALKNKCNDNLGFISLKSLKKTDIYSLSEQKLIDSFKEISKVKNKTRLKIKGDIEPRLESIVASDELNDLVFENITDLINDCERKDDAGFIVSEDSIICVFHRNNQWFLINQNFEESDFINEFVPLVIIRQIKQKTKRALVVMRKAKTFDDTRHLNNPIRLIIKTPTGEIKDKANR